MGKQERPTPYRSRDSLETTRPKLGFLDSLTKLGSRPVSGASAAAFRIAFGLLGVVAVVRFASKGWISDLYIVGWLLWGRSRLSAYCVLCVFHMATWLLFPIGMFTWIMARPLYSSRPVGRDLSSVGSTSAAEQQSTPSLLRIYGHHGQHALRQSHSWHSPLYR